MDIRTDQHYFGEYFTLCEFYLNRRGILEKVWENVRENSCEGEYWAALKELKKIDAFIREESQSFWCDVNAAKERGVRLLFEEFAQVNGLGTFEKKTALFILYMDLFHPVHCIKANELVSLLDVETSWDSKLKAHNALMPECALFKRNILVLKEKGCGMDRNDEVALNPATRSALTGFVSGIAVEILPVVKESPAVESVDLRDPEYGMDDVILPQKIKEDVLFHIDAWKGGLGELGVHEKIKKGRGAIFLFYGPPGTGKSMLADAVARRVGKKVYQVALPQVTARFFGDTEKNISNLFKTAMSKDAVLCFDEADSLLYNRQSMIHERDIAFVNVMLQEIERFEGVLCLTTNLDNALDPALERRVSLKVRFTPPDQALRPGIWRTHIPPKVTIAPDVDFDELGRKFVMSGGYIKNAVLNALRRLAQDKRTVITMDDLLFGARM
ncbi:MAG: ATP-binding protein, partial [Candidatus Omnitrophica bacterium]|nr:ATP-binding protein [Candidatus Omnitrophota bacterium]